MDKKEKIKRSILIIFIMIIAVVSIISSRERRQRKKEEKEQTQITGNYNVDIIKSFNKEEGQRNYLLSPYNIEIALNMLREGSDGNTKAELDKVLGSRKINDVSVKDKIGIANAIFVKDIYKNNVKKDYYNILGSKYNSEVIYDEFITPDKINNWVKEKTNNMIEKILDGMSDDFVMGIASALAIDVKWQSDFDCNNTESEEFTKINKEKINVEMMHKTYETDAEYIKNSDYEGIIIPYQKEENSNVELEFIGILPNDGIDKFINNLTEDKLNNITQNAKEGNEKYHIILSLPRFTYSYEAADFKGILRNIGIKEVFDPVNANLKKMVEIDNYNTYVDTAIHKTYIEVTEKGTKAAAVTYFSVDRSAAMPMDVETVNIKFDKPFIYMIREKNTNEILFFGTVYEPNIWKGNTCSFEQ